MFHAKTRSWSVALLLPGLLGALTAGAARPPSPFGVQAVLHSHEGTPAVRFSFEVPSDHVIYAERLHFETEDGQTLTPLRMPTPVVAQDKATGREKQMYDRPFSAEFKLDAAAPLNLVVKFQGCSNSACYFPEKRMFTVNSTGILVEAKPAVSAPVKVTAVPDAEPGDWHVVAGKFKVVARETGYMKSSAFLSFLNQAEAGGIQVDSDPLARFRKLGLAATLFFIVIGGAGLNLTPCVLPLIPINLAIIGAGKRARSRRQGFMHGAVYGAGMALAYGVLGLVVVLTGSKFGTLNSSFWFNAVIALVFVVLALAMFDLVNLDFSRFESGVGDSVRGYKSQGLVAFCLGAMAALLAGACVAPVVISVLLLATNLYGKGLVIGLALPFLLGVGMALPWPFAGASLTFLPKPGKWMTWIKYGFGVLILVFAAYYGHLAYNLFRTQRVATALGATHGPGGKELPIAGANQSLAKALEHAHQEGRLVFLDFQASWCKNCLAMEETVFNQAGVQKRLQSFIVVKYQAERPNEGPAKEVLDHFGVMGLPTYLVLAPSK